MTDRKCSCCGKSYTDDTRHDYERCAKDCERWVEDARRNLNEAMASLEMAKCRRESQRTGKIP